MDLILKDLRIYNPYILRTGGKKEKIRRKKEKCYEEHTEFEQAL